MRSCFKTKTLRQKHKDYIHDVLQCSVKFTEKQVQSIQILEKQNKLTSTLPTPNTLLTFKRDEFINQLYKFSTQPSMQGYSMGIIDCFYPELQ